MPRAQIAIKGTTAMWIIEQELPMSEIERMREDGLQVGVIVHEEEADEVPQFLPSTITGWRKP